jgi:hypothetical protein
MDGYTALGGVGEWFVGSLKWYGWWEPFAGPLSSLGHSAELVFKICPPHPYCAGLHSAFQLLVRIRPVHSLPINRALLPSAGNVPNSSLQS